MRRSQQMRRSLGKQGFENFFGFTSLKSYFAAWDG